ncbi:MAG: exodeoxyribonuclease V subunit alpha [Desulfatibacillaceae bacterium]
MSVLDLDRPVEPSWVDVHFARFLARRSGDGRDGLFAAAVLASQRVRRGDICCDLSMCAGTRVAMPGGENVSCPELDPWREELISSPAVGGPGDFRPLVLDGDLLYLHRYHAYETGFVRDITGRCMFEPGVDRELLARGVRRVFGDDPLGRWQRVAAACAVLRRFCVVSGGPGTGKTTTVAGILALIAEQDEQAGRPTRIALCAPTGKAAARLSSAVSASMSGFRGRGAVSEAAANAVPTSSYTLHRILGARGDGRFSRNEENPLEATVVVVDEISMADLALMSRLTRALPPETRLLLLGDKAQLASVSPGSVLGDLCAPRDLNRFSPAMAGVVAEVCADTVPVADGEPPPLLDSVVELVHSFRFDPDKGIGRLARAIVEGDAEETLAALAAGYREVSHEPAPRPARLPGLIGHEAAEGYGRYLEADDPREALVLLDRFRVLCAVREGPWGVSLANREVERVLAATGLVDPAEGQWYHGRPLMVSRNDPSRNLFNGDTGLAWSMDGRRRAVFASTEAGAEPRLFSPLALPAHETVYAMTVHKSQGSEFHRVLVVLPDKPNPVLTRELLYTAVTRAREHVFVVAEPAVVRQALARRVQRASGLVRALWGGFADGDQPR